MPFNQSIDIPQLKARATKFFHWVGFGNSYSAEQAGCAFSVDFREPDEHADPRIEAIGHFKVYRKSGFLYLEDDFPILYQEAAAGRY